jgi:hypothetical protein
MADVFISYSRKDPEPTKALAADLEARGYTTWWDTSLLPGERFPDKIRQELEAAKVVIVIWSENSVKSTWVQAEAHFAQSENKLITVCVPGFDVRKVPLPYNVVNIEEVTNREKIYAALVQFNVKAKALTSAPSPTTFSYSRAVRELEAAENYGQLVVADALRRIGVRLEDANTIEPAMSEIDLTVSYPEASKLYSIAVEHYAFDSTRRYIICRVTNPACLGKERWIERTIPIAAFESEGKLVLYMTGGALSSRKNEGKTASMLDYATPLDAHAMQHPKVQAYLAKASNKSA